MILILSKIVLLRSDLNSDVQNNKLLKSERISENNNNKGIKKKKQELLF